MTLMSIHTKELSQIEGVNLCSYQPLLSPKQLLAGEHLISVPNVVKPKKNITLTWSQYVRMPGRRPWTLLNFDISHGCLKPDPKQRLLTPGHGPWKPRQGHLKTWAFTWAWT